MGGSSGLSSGPQGGREARWAVELSRDPRGERRVREIKGDRIRRIILTPDLDPKLGDLSLGDRIDPEDRASISRDLSFVKPAAQSFSQSLYT